jgi:hypothetical protein
VWSSRFKGDIASLEKIARVTGRTPKSLLDRPHLDPNLGSEVEAFYFLSSGRRGADPIPMTEMEAYARIYGMYDVPRFVALMRRVDVAVLDAASKKTEDAPRGSGQPRS